MRRTRMDNHINRNKNTKVNHLCQDDISSCDPITPEIVVGQIWLQDDTDTKGVQIKELNSSNTDGSAESLELQDRNYPWFYNNHERLQRLEENFRINRKARELRRERIANQYTPNSPKETDVGENYALEDFFINPTSNTDSPDNHVVNCFTILNKHVMNSSATSSDTDYEDVDIFTPRDSFQDRNDKDFESEVVTYDPEQCSEKRTIWIYSFKNKRLLSEDNFELVNIPSNNNTSESSTSIEKNEEAPNDKPVTMCRVSSPFPAIYVPKLNLNKGPTLSTLTEVTEPHKPSSSVSNETEKSFEEEFVKRKHNGWFINDNKDRDEKNVKKQNSNVINWMALSPRERRRKFRTITIDANLPTVAETNSRVEVKAKNENADDFVLPELPNVVVDVIVHTVDEDGDIKSTISPKYNWLDKLNTKENVPNTIITSEEVIEGNENDDRGDYKRKSLRKLHIKLDSKKLVSPVVSDPIEKLDGSSWIGEDDREKARRYITSDTEAVVRTEAFETEEDQNSASRRLFARNLCLMKPALWQEYAPITRSPISLHLSFNSLVDIKQSWYKRLFKCFKWCKRN